MVLEAVVKPLLRVFHRIQGLGFEKVVSYEISTLVFVVNSL